MEQLALALLPRAPLAADATVFVLAARNYLADTRAGINKVRWQES
jgi:hypothetical protein